MQKRRIVVTGVGMVSPLGNDVKTSWQNTKAGKSGVAPISNFDTTNYSVKFAAQIKDFDISKYINAKDANKMDLFLQYGYAAGLDAVADANFDFEKLNLARVGVSVGSGIGGLKNIEKQALILQEKGPRRISPFFIPSTIVNMTSGYIAMKYGFKGANIAFATACSTGAHSIGYAARTIAYGDADVMIAGGAEMASSELGVAGFAAMRALSTRNDEPQKASRPWDKDRDGFVIGDGACVLVLEELEHAKARGAKIYAEFAGFGMSDDAAHITLPPTDGAGAALSMQNALNDANMQAEQIHYVNAHGTSTPAGDLAEINAVKTVFQHNKDKLAVSSTKSMTGHTLGAAGAIEAAFSILAMQDNIAPPTINLENPDEGCDLNLVANKAQEMQIDAVLSNSFGFGGTNASLIFKRFVD